MPIDYQDNSGEVLKALELQAWRALEKCGLLGERYAKENIRAVGAIDTGRLRNSITHVVDMGDHETRIGTNVDYAPYVELGTGIYAAGGRKTPWAYQDRKGKVHFTRGSRPKPYLKPAIADHAADYKNVMDKEFRD